MITAVPPSLNMFHLLDFQHICFLKLYPFQTLASSLSTNKNNNTFYNNTCCHYTVVTTYNWYMYIIYMYDQFNLQLIWDNFL